ncbi:FAD-dependent oxidoreductase [Ornithinimicrobium sp. Y1694]|uniref:FAD-dependent oxidoreductase n=1 Tax=Ornithinimicrobium sp. Y1694 TaxID=3418590 RepID=UPI003CED1C0F
MDTTSLWQATSTTPDGDPFPVGAAVEVVVVGAGITGVATAHALRARGLEVMVLEARDLGGVTTARTTGKVSLLQGRTLSRIRRAAGAEAVTDYLAVQRVGQQWWRDVVGVGADLQVRDALTYAVTSAGRDRLLREWQASVEAGLPVEAVGAEAIEVDLPLPTSQEVVAIRLRDQLQTHPTRALAKVLAQLRADGVTVVSGVRVTGVKVGEPTVVRTDHGDVRAQHVVLATGTPILDRGMQFARLTPERSYAISYRLPDGSPPPQGMYLSTDDATRSIRSVPLARGEDAGEGSADGAGGESAGELVVVGGNGHVVGREQDAAAKVDGLHAWSQRVFTGAERLHTWSAQDYRSDDSLPIVGPLVGDDPRILSATGFGKWGLTNGAAAGIALAGWVTGEVPPWAQALGQHRWRPGRVATLAQINATVAAHLAGDWARGLAVPLPDAPPAEGEGVVGRRGVVPVACSTVDGSSRAVSAICTHLGAVLSWNSAERTWDCPLHGSRFDADGSLLEGPATRPLDPA